jgi:hypothetical protein
MVIGKLSRTIDLGIEARAIRNKEKENALTVSAGTMKPEIRFDLCKVTNAKK